MGYIETSGWRFISAVAISRISRYRLIQPADSSDQPDVFILPIVIRPSRPLAHIFAVYPSRRVPRRRWHRVALISSLPQATSASAGFVCCDKVRMAARLYRTMDVQTSKGFVRNYARGALD
jgi:hypothetical protein